MGAYDVVVCGERFVYIFFTLTLTILYSSSIMTWWYALCFVDDLYWLNIFSLLAILIIGHTDIIVMAAAHSAILGRNRIEPVSKPVPPPPLRQSVRTGFMVGWNRIKRLVVRSGLNRFQMRSALNWFLSRFEPVSKSVGLKLVLKIDSWNQWKVVETG